MISRNPSRSRGFFFTARLCLPLLSAVSLVVATHGSSRQHSPSPKPMAYFTDVAKEAGLTMVNVFGGEYTKKYIIETTGTGVAIFDYDNDGWPDIFIVNSTKLEVFPSGKPPSNHLYPNNHAGTSTHDNETAGLARTACGQGVDADGRDCIG